MCLDVDLKSSFSTANYPLVAANQAQFASAGSYTEMLTYAEGRRPLRGGGRRRQVEHRRPSSCADDGKINHAQPT